MYVCFTPLSPLGYFDRTKPNNKNLSWQNLPEDGLPSPAGSGWQTEKGEEAHGEGWAGLERGGVLGWVKLSAECHNQWQHGVLEKLVCII